MDATDDWSLPVCAASAWGWLIVEGGLRSFATAIPLALIDGPRVANIAYTATPRETTRIARWVKGREGGRLVTCLGLLLLRAREWGRGCPLLGSRMGLGLLTVVLVDLRYFSSQPEFGIPPNTWTSYRCFMV